MSDNAKADAEKAKRDAIKKAKQRLEDLETHGVEVEDDTQAAAFDVNFGCGKG